ncbi:MAG: hypothetical protein FJZ86_08800 [Chloroflexi bacterium]|nr:hypothetical protein [Chloroflexota bacterium]
MLNKTVLEKFLVSEQAGENDLFLTYNGKDTQTGLTVNVTAIKPNMVAALDFLERFESLAKAITKIESPHTVPILDYGEVEGQAVIVRAGIEGQSLANLVTGGNGLQLDIAFDIARQLGEYVEAIHQAGVFQVVFDPGEILLSSDSVVRVTNLGMAQGLNIGELLAEGKAKAQPYHAPELLRGEKADPRTDFYSLGALLFQILTGKELDANAIASDRSLITDLLPSRQRLGIPPEWDELVAKCLHPVPAKRIQSAAEFLNRVTEVQRGMAEGAQATMIGMEDSLVGQTLGAYRLVERLGQGGMATVYKGYEAALDRYVAVKVLPQFFASDPNFTQRFRREAKAIAQLNHPNIIPIYSYGEQSGITYLVMQFVEGGTLKHERGQTHSPEEALRLLLPIARALGYAHGRGIVHRDIKPSNVLMAEGNWPMLADFGLAQMAESSMRLTGTGVGLGTPMYMSPEQGCGDQVDARTDIYSLGIMLYELVTGDVPFRADTPMAIVIKHMTAPMPMPRQLNPNIPAEVENIILKSTAKDADDRYQTTGEMATAMERVLNRLAMAIKEEEVVEEVRPKKIKPERLSPVKPPIAKKALNVILGFLGVCLLGVVVMGIFDICPPVGPWPQPPWCPGSPYKLPTFGGGSATSVPIPMITEGTLGSILFQDDFDGEPSMRWDFQPRRWETTTMDGRTVLLSDTSESTAFVGLKADGWTDYAVQFDFKFLKPDEHNAYYFYLRFRATDCPPTVQAMDNYVALITTDIVELRDESCETQMQEQVAQSDRNISAEGWHTAQVIAIGNRVRLLIDGEQYFDYTDSESPHLDGGVTLDLDNKVGLAIDNFRVNEIIAGGTQAPTAAPGSPEALAAALADPWGTVVIAPGDSILIGVASSLTGDLASMGQDQRDAAQLAISETGDVAGFPIEPVSADDKCTAEGGQAAAKELLKTDSLAAVVGTTCSSALTAAMPLFDVGHIVFISPSATRSELSQQGSQTFNRLGLTIDVNPSDNPVADPSSPEYQSFAAKFKAAVGRECCQPFAAEAYDAATILLKAIESVAVVDEKGQLVIPRQALAQAVRSTSGYDGVSGKITFDANGDRTP